MSTESSSEAIVIRAVFSALNGHGIRYAVMRNFETLPLTAGGSDIDVLIDPVDMRGAIDAVLGAIRDCGGSAFQITGPAGLSMIAALGQHDGHRASDWWGLRIDLFDQVSFGGRQLLVPLAELPIKQHGDIRVLDAGFAAVLGVLKEVLHNEAVPTKYFDVAREFATRDWRCVESLLGPMGMLALDRLQTLLVSSDDSARCRTSCRSVRTALNSTSGSLWSRALRQGANKVARYLRPPGLMIAFMGVDGSGKSTVIDAVVPVLSAATHRAVTRLHLRPWLFPALGRFIKIGAPANDINKPHEKTPSGVLISLVRASYLLTDYCLGYWIKIRPILARRPAVVLFDRYAYDMAVDQARFRIRLPPALMRILSAIAPKPDLVLCMTGDAAVIVARKDELSEAEIDRQTRMIQFFASAEPRAQVIRCDGPLQETTQQVLCAIRSVLRARGG